MALVFQQLFARYLRNSFPLVSNADGQRPGDRLELTGAMQDAGEALAMAML